MDTSNSLLALPRDDIQELGEELPNTYDEILIIGKANDDDEDEAFVSSFPPSASASSSSIRFRLVCGDVNRRLTTHHNPVVALFIDGNFRPYIENGHFQPRHLTSNQQYTKYLSLFPFFTLSFD